MALSDWNTIDIYRNMVEIELKYGRNRSFIEDPESRAIRDKLKQVGTTSPAYFYLFHEVYINHISIYFAVGVFLPCFA
jgi:hypothetical protein